MTGWHVELEQLRAIHPAHANCKPCRHGDCENCLYLTRPTSCGHGCQWLKDGRLPTPEGTRNVD